MRVAHLITRLIVGGAQENTILNCQGLIEQFGDEVLLITGPGLGPEGSLEADAAERGIPVAVIPQLRREIHPTRDLASFREIVKRLRAYAPDVVHTHSGKGGLLGRLAARHVGVGAIVHTVHGAPFHRYQSWVARSFFRRCEIVAARRCDAIISVADAMTDQLVAAGVAGREIFTTIYSGMEVAPFLQAPQLRVAARRELGFDPEDIVVGKIARLFHLKGHDDVIAAARQAVSSLPQIKLLFVGGGVLRDQLERQVAAAGLEGHVTFTGRVPPAEIPRMIAAMDAVVHASYREGLARVLPQAMLAGLPAISYDIDGAREVVRDGQTGRLVPAGDVERLSESIRQIAGDSALRQQLGKAGRELCRTRFAAEHMTAQIRNLYQTLL